MSDDREYRNLRRRFEALQAKGVALTDRLQENLESVDFSAIKPYKAKPSKPTKRVVNILLSDLHFGSDLVSSEHPMVYGSTEERRRMAAIAKEVIEYKDHYRDHTELVVHLAGDIIQGRLHDPASAAPIAEQSTRAIYLLSAFLARMSEAYPKVSVYCTPGNHGRIKDRHPGRAVDQKWDSFENIIYEAVRLACKSLKNVTVTVPRTPFYEYSLFGMRGFVTHGDTVLNPGYPNKSISVSRLDTQILKLAQARGNYDLVACGHVHIPAVVHLPHTVLITNGCLTPPDSYAISIGLHSNASIQQLWETVPGYMFGDHRMLNVGPKHDRDASLDAIIPEDK